ncbi:MAG TPA: copper chaperone PCu(A)C [Luteimonas sp.]|nr:copper chaperone PCu(A)C [Luteimonas sp.]
MNRIGHALVLVLLAALSACGGGGHGHGDAALQVSGAWSRAVSANAPVAAGYLLIANPGPAEVRLVAVRSDAAERVEIHEMRHEDGVMRMRELADGLAVPAGGSVELKPGGYHLMFIGPRAGAFEPGQRIDATLVLDDGRELAVAFEVTEMSASGVPGSHPH